MSSLMLLSLFIIIYYHCREEPMIPDEHDEVDLNDFDPEEDRARHQAQYDDDDDHSGHGPGVSCATQ